MDIEMFQKLLFFFDLYSQMRGDHIGDLVCLSDLLDSAKDFRCDLLVELDVLVELLHSGACQAFGVRTEVAVLLEDFRVDTKWPGYRDYCDRLYFATHDGVPSEIFPEDCGLIIADGASASDTISVGDGSALPHGVQHAAVYITIETEDLGNLEIR